jgi:hypothetical protein
MFSTPLTHGFQLVQGLISGGVRSHYRELQRAVAEKEQTAFFGFDSGCPDIPVRVKNSSARTQVREN